MRILKREAIEIGMGGRSTMAAKRWICAGGGGQEPVKIVHGDGQVLTFAPPVRVGEVLSSHPHHYICHMSPELPSNRSAMLSHDDELEAGYIYFLLPLPRLFPASSAAPISCCCHSLSNLNRGQGGANGMSNQKGAFSPLRVMQLVGKIGSPLQSAKKKVSPELTRSCGNNRVHGGKIFGQDNSPLLSPTYGKSSKRINKRCVSPKSSPNRLRDNANMRNLANRGKNCGDDEFYRENLCKKWKPGLGCISETAAFVAVCEELRHCLDRRKPTFDSKARPPGASPLHLSDLFKKASRDRDFGAHWSPNRLSLSGLLQI